MSEILDRVAYEGIAIELPLDDTGAPHLVKAYVAYDRTARPKVRRVREALGHLQAFGLGPVGEIRLRRIADEDWLTSWRATFTPVRVGPFLIHPSWIEPKASEAIPIAIDPGMAFGTGLHPTTQQCLELLGTLEVAGRSVLDVGTGSGILAIAAAKRGAARVVGVDTDDVALREARENAERNGVALELGLGSAADLSGEYDVVIANLVGAVISRIAPQLRARTGRGGTLVAAGIVAAAERETESALTAAGLAAVERDLRDDWVLLVCR